MALPKYRVCAFDIEKTGHNSEMYPVIETGAAVMCVYENGKREAVGEFSSSCYLPTVDAMEKRCEEEFWSNHRDILAAIENDSPGLADADRLWDDTWEKDGAAIRTKTTIVIPLSFADGDGSERLRFLHTWKLLKFFMHWEQRCLDEGVPLYMVTDNCIYDGGHLNSAFHKYFDLVLGFPYNFANNKYKKLYDISQMAVGALLPTLGPEAALSGKVKNKIEAAFNLPEPAQAADHRAKNDSLAIAEKFINFVEGCAEYSRANQHVAEKRKIEGVAEPEANKKKKE